MTLNEYDIKIITTLITEELQIANDNDTQWIKELSDLFEKIEGIDLVGSCNGCRFKPQQNGTYPETCSECCRWFGDKYEEIVK